MKLNSGKLFHTFLVLTLFLLFASCNSSKLSQEDNAEISSSSLPYIKESNGVKQLIVDDKPFVILGGELMNSSASSIEYMEPIWARVKSLNVNTILLPINWQQFEAVEGEFDYSLIDSHIKKAHENDLRIIILWFGSWKNGRSHYTPDWVKTDMDRFPRMRYEDQIITPTISNISEECLKADTKAYLKLIKRIKEVDSHNTVIMMQIQNEVGLLGGSRDFSPAAQELFEQNVPFELINHINQNIDKVKPFIREAYRNNGSKQHGSWEGVFGKSLLTDEIFMAWNYALYINHIAKAGKEVHNIPTLVNAWVAAKERKLGEYPSGGPNYRMLDIWLAGAPYIDILAVDNYEPYFDEKCNDFVHQGNPLFMPEAVAIWKGDTISAGAKAFYTIGHYNAICFSPFGIDHETYHSNHPLKNAYQVLGNLMPFITRAQVENRIDAFMEYDESIPKIFSLGDYQFTVNYNIKKAPHIKGYGLVIQTGTDEFIIAGNAFRLDVESINASIPTAQLISVEEGVFVDGIWQRGRVLNGDEFHIKFPAKPYDLVENVVLDEVAIHKVKLFTHDDKSKGENLTPF
jgi:hypothetical protein